MDVRKHVSPRTGRISWQARWRDPAGEQRKQSFPRRGDADRFLTTVASSKITGNYVAPAAGRVTFGEFAESWLASKVNLKPSTRESYRSLLRSRVLPRWAGVPLSAVTHADTAAWVADLDAAGLGASRIRKAHVVLSQVLELAVRDGRLGRNPADDVPLPRLLAKERRYLSHQQVAALAEAAGADRAAIFVLAYCGLRIGELAGLQVSNVDLLRGRLQVVQNATEVAGHVIVGTPKGHRARSVPLPRFLRELLTEHLAGRDLAEPAFPAPEGGVLRAHNFQRRSFQPAVKACGLVPLTPHDLRHTSASLAISAGANVKAVQRMLGHASAAMTLDVYADLFDDDLDAVAERMDAARAPHVPQMCPNAVVTDLDERRLAP